jgi:cation transport regulator ChaC
LVSQGLAEFDNAWIELKVNLRTAYANVGMHLMGVFNKITMKQDANKWSANSIGIFGYGSLVSEPGAEIAANIIGRIALSSPWPVEYARSSKRRAGAPTLVIHQSGGIVNGQILVLESSCDLASARRMLWEREGQPPQSSIKCTRMGPLRNVLYVDLEANIADAELTADHLAELAMGSVALAGPLNGIRYLTNNIERGIITPLTNAYRNAILKRTSVPDLEQAEAILCNATADRVPDT